MVVINEIVSLTIREDYYSYKGVRTINSNSKDTLKCTWLCHDETITHCQVYHVKHLNNYYTYTDPMYMGIIKLLMGTGHYGIANIIFLVILIPFMIFFFFIKSIIIQLKINELKNYLDE